MMDTRIDLNADLGEGDPYDPALLNVVSSCNVACGGHAGDKTSMRDTVSLAKRNGVSVGAHPAYPDREGFGRRSRFLQGEALLESLLQQIGELREIAAAQSVAVAHVKPHGALYNDAVRDRELANLIAVAISTASPESAYVGLPMSEMQLAANEYGLRFVGEGFVDRAYRDDGQLVPRTEPGAVHDSLDKVLPQAVSLVGKVETLCIHGDTPGADIAAAAVRKELESQGVEIRAFSR